MNFSKDWLALREPHDARARDNGLAERLAEWARAREELAIVDLGSGTGANLRWLAPRLPPRQYWRLVEIDPELVRAGRAMLPATPAAHYLEADLATALDAAIAGRVDLVTASALLDLVSKDWLARLVGLSTEVRAAILMVLTYDGRIELDPPHRLDSSVIRLFNRHQTGDKGFGPALGPEAPRRLIDLLTTAPGELLTARSDWVLGAADQDLQNTLITEYAQVALTLAPTERDHLLLWRAERLAAVAEARLTLTIGHLDVLFLPN
jgi:hypothetical protein